MTRAIDDVAATALGRQHREDPVAPGSGGPAGNARLTAWLGLLLLVLFTGELATLLDLRGLISWHLALGLLLVPPALVKTASTSWRVLRYYSGSRPYVVAGPPPVLLRLLGPLVVVGTLAVLSSGIALVLVGPSAGFRPLVTVLGQGISPLLLHKVAFAGWVGVTGLHVLARLVPAWQLVTRRPAQSDVPGRARRALALGAVAVVAAGVAVAVGASASAGAWRTWDLGHRGQEEAAHDTGRS